MLHLNFDVTKNVEDFTYVLSTRNFTHLGQLNTVVNVIYKRNLNAANEISLDLYQQWDGINCYVWDLVVDLKLLYVPELDEYFEIAVTMDETIADVKHISGTSLCESELGQIMLYDIEINTETDILREDYLKPTIFYNEEEPQNSLLNRIMEKAPHYKIGHVDDSLKKIQRTFQFNNQSIYDTLVGDIAQEIDCLFLFDSATRTINAYDLESHCKKCGERGDFMTECPECHSTNLELGYGEDTTIFVSRENLANQITVDVDKDSVKNCFRLVAGDGLMTSTVRNCLPNGSQYITLFTEPQIADMSKSLVSRLQSYNDEYSKYEEEYSEVMLQIYKCIDDGLYYQSGMMPKVEQGDIDVATEIAKLTEENLSPISVSNLKEYTSLAVINSAVRNYAEVFVYSRYKIEVSGETLTYNAGSGTATWTGKIILTNYGDEEDKAETGKLSILINTDYENFLKQKIEKMLKKGDDEDQTIFDVVNIDYAQPDTLFLEALTCYSLNRLTQFQDMYQRCLDILEEERQANENAEIYEVFFDQYNTRLQEIQAEMAVRQKQIDDTDALYKKKLERQKEIQELLDLEKFLGEKLWLEYSAYRREDVYENNNYISDDLSNEELFENAQEFIKVARQELEKAASFQYSLSTTMNNLLATEEFLPIIDHFEVGNWIRVEADEQIYRLRLTSYTVDFNSIANLAVEFSDVTRALHATSDVENIVNSVKKMSTDYSYIQHQQSINNNNINDIVDKFTTSIEVQEAMKTLINENFKYLTEQIVELHKEIDALSKRIN